jgi:large subunit ribosomal protein L37Ae
MAKTTVGFSKTYGARYGPRVRDAAAALEVSARAHYKCPYCSYTQVKRVSTGVWHCKKCDAKFTGRAYSADKKFASPYALETEGEAKASEK